MPSRGSQVEAGEPDLPKSPVIERAAAAFARWTEAIAQRLAADGVNRTRAGALAMLVTTAIEGAIVGPEPPATSHRSTSYTVNCGTCCSPKWRIWAHSCLEIEVPVPVSERARDRQVA